MNLYKISQTDNDDYNTFDSAIVCAVSEYDAKTINPDGREWGYRWSAWCKSPDDVTVELLGTALDGVKRGVVLGSFRAG